MTVFIKDKPSALLYNGSVSIVVQTTVSEQGLVVGVLAYVLF